MFPRQARLTRECAGFCIKTLSGMEDTILQEHHENDVIYAPHMCPSVSRRVVAVSMLSIRPLARRPDAQA